jgi:hypothetical protein
MSSPPLKKGQLPREKTLRWLAFSAITILAAVLRFLHLNSLGYANHYYTAAVTNMLKSWHNFLYVAAESGGSVSVEQGKLCEIYAKVFTSGAISSQVEQYAALVRRVNIERNLVDPEAYEAAVQKVLSFIN